MLFIIILIIIGYFIYQSQTQHSFVSCDSSSEVSCKMYSIRDKQTKCSSMCVQENPKYIYTGNHTEKDGIHTCECALSKVEKFSKIDEDTHILSKDIPNDALFGNRDYVEKHEKDRLHNLIFG